MDDIEESGHSFIIRIWKEKREYDAVAPLSRGLIEHVPSGRKRYFQNLMLILAFIMPYLEEMGLKNGLFWRMLVRPWTLQERVRRRWNKLRPRPENRRQDEEWTG